MMYQEDSILKVLDALLSAEGDSVTIELEPTTRKAASRLKDAIVERTFEALVSKGKADAFATIPLDHLTDPEDLKYLQLFRDSYTVEEIQAPKKEAPRAAPVPSMWKGFKGAVKRTIIASRFISQSKANVASAELDQMMDNVVSWQDFNINRVGQLSERQPLLMVGISALNHFNLLSNLNLDPQVAVNFIKVIEHHYMPNPYHNSTHAADVTQALMTFISLDGLQSRFTDLELLAMIMSAIMHDVAHPGFNNPFLCKTQDEQSLMYNDQSANEALSLAIGFKVLQAPECNVFANFSRENYFYVRRLITDIVLGTDMAVHSQMLEQARSALRRKGEGHVLDSLKSEHRILAMKALVHVADISNPCRVPKLAGMWTRAVYEEFFKQGEAEKELGIEVSPLCDRDEVAIPESQKVFLSFVVKPTAEVLTDLAPLTVQMLLRHLDENLKLWTRLAEQGDRSAVICGEDQGAPELLYVSPSASPFHSTNQTAWGNADMLLLLLNDEHNTVVGRGIDMILQRQNPRGTGHLPANHTTGPSELDADSASSPSSMQSP